MAEKKAKWIQHEYLFKKDQFECSNCRYLFDKPYNVCPRCKSVMIKVKYDPDWVDEMEEFDAIFDD